MGRTSQDRRGVGGFSHSRCSVAEVGASRSGFSCVPVSGPAWLAEDGSGHTAPQERPPITGGLEKKLPEALAHILNRADVKDRPVRLVFQDEARFGRMVRLRRCWAAKPFRPTVCNGYERKFVYVYGAVSPLQGELDWMICGNMNTDRMNEFLAQVSGAHPEDFIIMILDGASSHISKGLSIPENIRFHRLPGYSPELNPQEHVWDELREKEFPNRVFDSLDGVVHQLQSGLPRLAADTDALRSLTAWPWIVSINLTAT
jgi:hypothetical protein